MLAKESLLQSDAQNAWHAFLHIFHYHEKITGILISLMN